ncbi:L,D-transpeptidase family protein [Albidovulum sediminicola]|uniref:L,D-transpeptidase family protein n=1 Tax=Albidovulum sediminicola TaxID=2984331 RepID=A0ABT2Z3U8_9RHOB|nr:L,D-transpeptidase family protein [Defluviimonas sp. WL0075]MCV2865782.1 L,D-transpeptidase family protein [Defluviimonas sp. WL0075]
MSASIRRHVAASGRLLAILAAIWAVLAVSGRAEAEVTPFRQAVAEAAAGDPVLSGYYRDHDYAPLWTTGADAARRAALFIALDHAGDHGLPLSHYGAADLRKGFERLTSERQRGRLEVAMSRAFLAYAHEVQTGFIKPASIDPGLVRAVPERDLRAMLEQFAVAEPNGFLRSLPPQMPQYAQLMKTRLDLERAMLDGGWGPDLRIGKLEPGAKGAAVAALRDKLVALGYLRASATQVYDGTIQKAVQRFQLDNGMQADGVVGEGTVAELNRTPAERLQSVLVAMERLRWMNGIPLGERHIWVNLPDFTAKVIDHGKVTFETVTVVGMNQGDRRSPEFSDLMEFMVINPTWNVPRSIATKEYLPMLQKDPNSVRHLRITDRRGQAVDREAVDFTQFTASNFPFAMSQAPSGSNALGLVKFMFPNPYNIYLHDTPSKSLFKREVRAFSHGCIRLGSPFDFAYTLLAPQSDDPVGLFKSYLQTGRESTLPLDRPVPVHLVYFTAWPSAKGGIEYRRDVYGRDAKIFDAMRAAGVELAGLQG